MMGYGSIIYYKQGLSVQNRVLECFLYGTVDDGYDT